MNVGQEIDWATFSLCASFHFAIYLLPTGPKVKKHENQMNQAEAQRSRTKVSSQTETLAPNSVPL